MTVALVNRIIIRKQWNKSIKCFLRNYASLIKDQEEEPGPPGGTKNYGLDFEVFFLKNTGRCYNP